MRLSMTEARKKLEIAFEAADRGERVVVTRYGRPFIEFVLASPPQNEQTLKPVAIKEPTFTKR